MEVDLGAGLGDDLGGFDALDELFAPSSTPDFFKSSILDNGTQAAVTAPPSPGSSGTSSSWPGDGEGDFAHDDWNQPVASIRRENVKLESIKAVGALTEPAMHVRNSKPRARKRHDEDEALQAIETAHPSMKVRKTSGAIVSFVLFSYFLWLFVWCSTFFGHVCAFCWCHTPIFTFSWANSHMTIIHKRKESRVEKRNVSYS